MVAGLLERDDALAVLFGAHAEARAGSGRIVLISGEAGIGKTALVQGFLSGLPRGTRVLAGRCDPLFAPRPLAPFADIAREAYGTLADAIRGGCGAHEAFEALWAEVAGGEVAVLVIEDVHWADEATLDVLRLLGRRVQGAAALVIVTYRDDELDRVHPLRRVLGELDSDGQLERVAIDPLSVAAVGELARGTVLDPGELYRRTSGNPFFVQAALDAGGERIPESIRAAVFSRIAPASRAASELVDTVALAPPDMPVWLLERVCGDAVAALDEALATGVLSSVGSAVRFRHELAREAVAETVSPARRLDIHRRLLDGLSQPPVGTPDAARLAHHAEAALDRDAVLRWSVLAAEDAAEARAYREAAAQYARALRFADGLPPDAVAELLEGRSRACYLADDQVEAIAVIEEAITYRRTAGSAREQARALCELTSYLMCRGRWTEAESAVAEAETLVADQPPSTSAASVLAVRALLVYTRRHRQGGRAVPRSGRARRGRR